MTTPTPQAPMHSGRLDIHTVALEPIHHGGGKAGNTNLVRLQRTIDPLTGIEARTPFISGNSIRHLIRASGAWWALEAMGFEQEWSKAAVDLIFSGGRLSGGGTTYRLDKVRELEALFPITAAMGYAAGNYSQPSKIAIDHLHLVCSENRWRMEARAEGLRAWEKRAGFYISEGFGTRHDALKGDAWKLLESGEAKRIETAISEGKGKAEKESQQMIYDHQIVDPGSHWIGAISYKRLSNLEYAALSTALEHATLRTGPPAVEVFGEKGAHLPAGLVIPVGAMASKGMGKMAWWFNRLSRHQPDLRAPTYTDNGALVLRASVEEPDDLVAEYIEHLRSNKERIVAVLKGMAK